MDPSTSYIHKASNILRHIEAKLKTLLHKYDMSSFKSPPTIPNGLDSTQTSIYKTIIRTINARPKGFEIPHVVVITDVGRDYDDLTAMIVLKELHRLGAIKLLGFIANLYPVDKRSHLTRQSLKSLGLKDIPVGQGTEGSNTEYKVKDWEFPRELMKPEPGFKPEEGQKLLGELMQNADKGRYKLTFLLLSSLRDISMFQERLQSKDATETHPLKHITRRIILQGGYHLEHSRYNPGDPQSPMILTPDHAANNDADWDATVKFHAFMGLQRIPSVVYTRYAAFDTPLTPTIFKDLYDTQHALGKALYGVQKPQNLEYYRGACQPIPVMPGRDQENFLVTRTTFYERYPPGKTNKPLPDPGTEDILQYCKVVVYDALAALGTSGDDILDALHVLRDPQSGDLAVHRVIGTSGVASTDPERMKHVLEALMMGALLDITQANI